MTHEEDIVLPSTLVRYEVLGLLFDEWPHAVVERAAPSEFLVYKSAHWLASWTREGRSDKNSDTMIHILFGANETTCVVGGPETKTLAGQIQRFIDPEPCP